MLEDEIQKEFENWFNDFYGRFSFRDENFYEDCLIKDEKVRQDILYKWISSAFRCGYECALYKKLEEEQSE